MSWAWAQWAVLVALGGVIVWDSVQLRREIRALARRLAALERRYR